MLLSRLGAMSSFFGLDKPGQDARKPDEVDHVNPKEESDEKAHGFAWVCNAESGEC